MGSSDSILLCKNIVESDKERRVVVVSAPGKAPGFGQKITDMLIQAHDELCRDDKKDTLLAVIDRFENLAKSLGVDIEAELERCIEEISTNRCDRDFVISRGEYLMALIFSGVLGYKFIDATRLVVIKPNGEFDARATRERCVRLKKTGIFDKERGIVVGGFFGTTKNGGVKTFARGGSDYSGAILACMFDATMYENFTDVNGVYTSDPATNPNARPIPRIDYDELYKLSREGANVIFAECLPLLKKYNVPLVIDNTFNPGKVFTTVTRTFTKI